MQSVQLHLGCSDSDDDSDDVVVVIMMIRVMMW